MLSKLLTITCLALTLLISGCATPTKMTTFSSGADELEKSGKAIYLLSVTTKNSFKPSHHPKIGVAHVEKNGGTVVADRLNFTIDNSGIFETHKTKGNTYLLRFELERGDYMLRAITSLSRSFLITGIFTTPIHSKIEWKAPGVYYLGHIEANIRERKDNEFKAGPTLPLIDQSVVGASTGTFDIEITDQWAVDEARFKTRFPALKNMVVTPQILPPFDREFAQKWWEDN